MYDNSENAEVQENTEVNPPKSNPSIPLSKQSFSATSISPKKLNVVKIKSGAKSDVSSQASGLRPSSPPVSSNMKTQGRKIVESS